MFTRCVCNKHGGKDMEGGGIASAPRTATTTRRRKIRSHVQFVSSDSPDLVSNDISPVSNPLGYRSRCSERCQCFASLSNVDNCP